LWLAAARSKLRIARVMWLACVTTTIFSTPCGCSKATVRMAFSRVSRDSASSQRSGRPKSRSAMRAAMSASVAPALAPWREAPAEGQRQAVSRASEEGLQAGLRTPRISACTSCVPS
jgi:hypothetical protein